MMMSALSQPAPLINCASFHCDSSVGHSGPVGACRFVRMVDDSCALPQAPVGRRRARYPSCQLRKRGIQCTGAGPRITSMLQIFFGTARSAIIGSAPLPVIVSMPRDRRAPPDREGDVRRDRGYRLETQRQSLLWIDDEIRPDDAVVRLLEMEGFHVDCADSGTVGLEMAQRPTYVGIILDLRLPDISGLSVLETLTRQQVPAPVLVLTGYPDFDAAVRAMRSGAWDCQSKTILLSDQWIGLVRALAEHGDKTPSRSIGLLSAHGAIMRELLDFLDELHKRSELPQRLAEHAPSDMERLRLHLLRTLADQRLNVFLFLVCAKALRLTLTLRSRALPPILEEISGLLNQSAVRDSVTPDWRVQAALAKLAEAEKRVGQIREEEIARELGVNRAHLGRLLRDATGFRFKQWRWGFLLRPGGNPAGDMPRADRSHRSPTGAATTRRLNSTATSGACCS
jgi:ActR/RegA family two-component response regulator/AraC-like DNA-binding protein